MTTLPVVRLASLKNVDLFEEHLRSLGVSLPCDRGICAGPLADRPGPFAPDAREPRSGLCGGADCLFHSHRSGCSLGIAGRTLQPAGD